MEAITQCESVVTYIKSCLLFQIPRFLLISKYCVISPLRIYEKEIWIIFGILIVCQFQSGAMEAAAFNPPPKAAPKYDYYLGDMENC